MRVLFLSALFPFLLSAQPEPLTVPLTEVVARQLQSSTVLPGELQPFRSVDVYARVSGFVESIAVDRSSRVSKGDTLATITAPELHARIAEAQARIPAIEAEIPEIRARAAEAQARIPAVEAEIAEVEARRSSLEIRLGHLRKAAQTPGAIALSEIELVEKAVDAENARIGAIRASSDAARAAVDAENARIGGIRASSEAARASVTALQAMLPYLNVKAEFNGVITERLTHEGSLAGPESKEAGPLFRLQQIDRLRLVVAVPESLVGALRVGARINFTVPAYPGQRFTGAVARPAYIVDPATRSMPVELDVDNSGGRLAPGMYAEVSWPMSRGQSGLLVPRAAIKATTERIFVIRVRNGVAEWVDVRRGPADGDLVEVTGDLQPGDRIVARATDEIRPGTPINAQ
jgi:RND family efflux transporter MFP subunit